MRPQLPLHKVSVVNNEKFKRLILLWYFSMLSYCVQLTKLLTSEGHIFNQELAFCLPLLEYLSQFSNPSSPLFYGPCAKKS